jgi:hypothetical protein
LREGNTELFHSFAKGTKDLATTMTDFKPWGSSEISYANKTPVSFGQLKGFKATSTLDSNTGISTYYFLVNDNLDGVLIFFYRGNEDAEAESIFNQIVKTLRIN